VSGGPNHEREEFGKIIGGKIMASFYDFAPHDFAVVFIPKKSLMTGRSDCRVPLQARKGVEGLLAQAGGDALDVGKGVRKEFFEAAAEVV
jgi:hypothetical protein